MRQFSMALAVAVASMAVVGLASGQVSDHRDAARLQRSIEFWQARVARNPDAYLEHTLLGEALSEQARLEGRPTLYQEAEDALRRSLQVNPTYARARRALAFVLVQLHAFEEAVALAESLEADDLATRAYRADAYMAVGRYEDARDALDVTEIPPVPALVSRRAQLATLEGRSADALALMEVARAASEASGDPSSVRAWYEFQTGELYLHRGRLEDAERHYRVAMALSPTDPMPWLGLGEVAAARGRTGEAIAWLERAGAAVADPEVLATLGDLHAVAGDVGTASRYYAQVESVCLADDVSARMYRTFLANFYADRGWQLDDAVTLALVELDRRQNVETLETAAWALYRTGAHERALQLVTEALELGAGDAELLYRAGQIAMANGKTIQGREWLSQSHERNPYYAPPAVQTRRGPAAE